VTQWGTDARCSGLVADEIGGIYPEALGELAQCGHSRLYLVTLDSGDSSRGNAGALGELRLA
jgi:hypothetical protein